MKKTLFALLLVAGIFTSQLTQAAADLEINTPAIAALQNNMQNRHGKLVSFYANGAVGLTKDGLIAVKDASAVPLKDRQSLNTLVAAENADRNNLYREIAAANAHPEWEAEIRSTFAQRWIQKAQSGWFYQDGSGWVKR